MRVVVVGAGFAGLRTALLLEGAGHEVILYDARTRVGGRAFTVATDRGWYEAGGEWIDSDHKRVLALLVELGMEPEPSDQYPGRIFYQGESCPEDKLWPNAAKDEKQWEAEAGSGNCKSLGDFLDSVCQSERGRWVAEAKNRSDEGEDTNLVGFKAWQRAYGNYSSREGAEMSALRFPEGAQAVCKAMAERLSGQLILGKSLTAVQAAEDHVELWFKDEIALADQAVLALPVSLYRDIDFGDSITFEMEEMLTTYQAARAIKVALRFKTKFWEGQSARLMADSLFQQCWDSSRGGEAVLACYICGHQAMEVLASPTPVRAVLESLTSIWPEAGKSFLDGLVIDWIHDPQSLGAFGLAGPQTHIAEDEWTKQGRIHFAGEWCSGWNGFFEGALESAERAVAEIGE